MPLRAALSAASRKTIAGARSVFPVPMSRRTCCPQKPICSVRAGSEFRTNPVKIVCGVQILAQRNGWAANGRAFAVSRHAQTRETGDHRAKVLPDKMIRPLGFRCVGARTIGDSATSRINGGARRKA